MDKEIFGTCGPLFSWAAYLVIKGLMQQIVQISMKNNTTTTCLSFSARCLTELPPTPHPYYLEGWDSPCSSGLHVGWSLLQGVWLEWLTDSGLLCLLTGGLSTDLGLTWLTDSGPLCLLTGGLPADLCLTWLSDLVCSGFSSDLSSSSSLSNGFMSWRRVISELLSSSGLARAGSLGLTFGKVIDPITLLGDRWHGDLWRPPGELHRPSSAPPPSRTSMFKSLLCEVVGLRRATFDRGDSGERLLRNDFFFFLPTSCTSLLYKSFEILKMQNASHYRSSNICIPLILRHSLI